MPTPARRRRRFGSARPDCSCGPAWCISPPASRSSSAAVACCPICVRPLSCTPWSTRSPSACCCSSSGGVASGIGILFVVPVGAMALLADSRDAFLLAALATLALFAQQIGGHVTGTAGPSDYPGDRHSRRHRLPRGVARLADRAPPARHRSHGAAPAGRSRQSRAAVAIHRAEPAREHRGRRPRKPHPPHQRIRGGAARRSQRLSRRAARRSLAAAALPTRNLAAAYRRRGDAGLADLRRGRRRPRGPAAFRAARRLRAHAGHRVPRRHRIAGGQDPAVQARGARPPFRQHRARNPQSRSAP